MQVCPACGRENPSGFRFCGFCGASLDAGADARGTEERKVVTVLFCDLVGFTARSESSHPEDVRARIRPYHARLREEIERFGGTVEKFVGDAVMAVFGAPVVHEDDAERAVRAGLRILESIEELNEADAGLDLQVRIGVNSGETLVDLTARPELGEGMVSGDVVNTAARLQSVAPVGGIVVGDQTFRTTQLVFEYEELAPAELKGRAERVPIWRAFAARARLGSDVTRSHARPLVGRELEKQLLQASYDRAVRDAALQLVTVVGEPGVGKSRLVAELFAHIDQLQYLVRWRQGRCLPYGEGISFWALGEIVKAHCGIRESDAPEIAAERPDTVLTAYGSDRDWLRQRVAPLVGIDSGAPVQREESFAAWRRFLEGMAADRPTVLVFEDLHWADAALLEFVEHLAEWADAVPLLVICTARPELYDLRESWGSGQRNATTITLGPLTDQETARLVSQLLEQAVLPVEVQTLILERTSGNPLYAEEFVRMLHDRGLLASTGTTLRLEDSGAIPYPETMQALIAARLDTLAPERKALLQDAAVIGATFWAGALAAMTGDDGHQVEQALHELARKELIRRVRSSSIGSETEYVFWHGIVRDVAYSQIPRATRAEKHVRAASWIELSAGERTEEHAEVLAHHYLAALSLQRAAGAPDPAVADRARLALRDAGHRARSLGAYAAAARFYGAALELWPSTAEGRAQLLFRYGDALNIAEGAAPAVLIEARDALLAEGNIGEAAEAELVVGAGAFDQGDGATGIKHMANAVRLVEGLPDSRSKALVLGHGSHRLMTAGVPKERAAELVRDSVRIARAIGDRELETIALNGLGLLESVVGNQAVAVESLEEAVSVARDVGPFHELRARGNLASMLADFGEVARSCALHDQALAIAREHALPTYRLWIEAECAMDLYLLGRWNEAWPELHAFLAEIEGSPTFMEAPVRSFRAYISLARGDLEGARADVERAVDLARESLEQQVLFPALSSAGRVALDSGRKEDAAAAADEIGREEHDVLPGLWFFNLAVTLAGTGRAHEVATLTESLVETPWLQTGVAFARGDFDAAAELLAGMGCRSEEAYVRLHAAEALTGSGQSAEAERELARARDFYVEVGATSYLSRSEGLQRRPA